MMSKNSYKGIRLHKQTDGRVRAEVVDYRLPGEVIILTGTLRWLRKRIDWYLSPEYRNLEALCSQ